MTKLIQSSLIVMIPILLIGTMRAQTVGTLGNVSVSVSVVYNPTTQAYSYSYSVTNPSTSTGKIDDFEIDISRPSGTTMLDTIGMAWADSGTVDMINVDYSAHYGQVTSVSFSGRPAHWTGSISNELMGGWFTTTSFLLSPSSSLLIFPQ